MNAATKNHQPPWDDEELLNPLTEGLDHLQRISCDKRNLSSHGRRLMTTLAGSAWIFNGLKKYGFDSSFTRLPTRTQDCAGVLDYIFGPPSTLAHVESGSMHVRNTPADFSDHHLVGVWLQFPETPIDEPSPSYEHFHLIAFVL